jgi:Na+-transporting methylmalonyl-CoA/oxaloacetate decarboxylase beta subunit
MTPGKMYTTRAVDRARRGIENCVTLALGVLLFSLAHDGGVVFGKLLSLLTP